VLIFLKTPLADAIFVTLFDIRWQTFLIFTTHLTDYAVWDCSPADVAPAWKAIVWEESGIDPEKLLPPDQP